MCLAIPGRVLSVSGDDSLVRTGRIDFGGIVKEISLAYTPEAQPGDYVLAHVGFAMTVIDELEAERILDALRAVVEAPTGLPLAPPPAAPRSAR
jgi:hydrogenase expression/formation protein HypC